MLRDVFYYGKKPNVHPREKFAENLADARNQAITEHFWIINEYCDYADFDWDFDFEFLPDEDVWATDHNNVWPSKHQKDSGTWLCAKKQSDIIIYRNDVDPINRKNEINEHWVILKDIDADKFDFSWHHDPTDPPYIYVFGNQWYDSINEPTVEYHVTGATQRKYMLVPVAYTVPVIERYKKYKDDIDFDYSWHPHPYDPPYIYVFRNQWYESDVDPVLEYHTPNATERKYVEDIKVKVRSTQNKNNWKNLLPIEDFDYSWYPNPNDPPYIYVFGNRYNDSATEPTVEYHVENATEKKYMAYPVATTKVNMNNWVVTDEKDYKTFDFSWRPNPYSPPQIYQWENNGPRYIVPGATDVVLMKRVDAIPETLNKYYIKTTLEDLINEHPDEVFWVINKHLNYDKFDFNWRPNEENFRHVNVFGNEYSIDTQTYYVNAPLYMMGYRDFNYVEETTLKFDTNLSMFFIDKFNTESQLRFEQLKLRYPQLQKTRYLNSWVETISRCINKTETKLFYVLSSELDYTDFTFDFYPSPWQEKMIHVFGTQHSHWGNTYLVNSETFLEDTKYVKIIEHLSVLNFVKSKRAKITNSLYDIVYIDHGNNFNYPSNSIVFKYEKDYLTTFKNIVEKLPSKKEHYIWVVSSICDYKNFDFTYVADPFAKDQLHVFPSDKQKYGDTFLIDVNKLRTLLSDMHNLNDYEKINFNNHQRVCRLPSPEFVVDSDTLTEITSYEYDFPYALYKTKDNINVNCINMEPISLWSVDTKNILTLSNGNSVIVAPKEIKYYVKNELYDYPYIKKSSNVVDSNTMDIVFISNNEHCADSNYEHLLEISKNFSNRVHRIDKSKTRTEALKNAASVSKTNWFYCITAKLYVNDEFDFKFQPDRLQIPKHYIFNAYNPVNDLYYGHQAMVLYNAKLVLENSGIGLDFTLDSEHESVDLNSGMAIGDTDEYSTWRTAFRESVKLKNSFETKNDFIAKERLDIWTSVGKGNYGDWSIKGAIDAIEFYKEVNGDLEKLRQSYYWDWLENRFKSKY